MSSVEVRFCCILQEFWGNVLSPCSIRGHYPSEISISFVLNADYYMQNKGVHFLPK